MKTEKMTTANDAESVVRRAYHAAEGSVLDVKGYVDLFAPDGVFNAIGLASYRGEHLGDMVTLMGTVAPDVHRELHRVHVAGNLVTVELSIRGTFKGPFPSPAGTIQPTGAKIDIPCADLWYVENGKIKEFNCYAAFHVMFAQLGAPIDFASAVKAQATRN